MAHVEETKKIVSVMCEVSLGIPVENLFERHCGNARRTTQCFCHDKGILGHATASLMAVEDHQKGTLHVHISFFGGLTPFALQAHAGVPDLIVAMAGVLDRQFLSKLPSAVLLKRAVKDYVKHRVPSNWSNSEPPEMLLRRHSVSCVLKKWRQRAKCE